MNDMPNPEAVRVSSSAPAWFGAMERRGEAPALIVLRNGAPVTMSFGELTRRVHGLCTGALCAGLQRGDAVALSGPAGFDWIVARLALAAAGLIAVPIDETASAADMQAILAQCAVKCVICPVARARELQAAGPQLKLIAFGNEGAAEGIIPLDELSRAPPGPFPEISPQAVAMYAFTSGTTGVPKAIVLSHANIDVVVQNFVHARLATPRDRVLLPLPLNHIYPYVVGILCALGSGAAVVIPETIAGPQLIDAIRMSEATIIVGVPRLFSALYSGLAAQIKSKGTIPKHAFEGLLWVSGNIRRRLNLNLGRALFAPVRARLGRKLRLFTSGGARLDDESLRALLALGFDLRSGYGLAETASSFTANLPGSERWGSEGKAFVGAVRIAAPDMAGIGEIELKGPQVFSHYLDNPQASANAFTTDGWFRTGDIGRLDRDGFLYVSGRAGDTLVLGGGKKVDPEVLEKIYAQSRYIREIAVLEQDGRLVALIVPALDAVRAGGAIHLDTAIRVELASRARALPSHERLSGFAIVRQPLPRTRLGKYRRFLLPQIYRRAQQPTRAPSPVVSSEDQALLNDPIARRAFDLLRQRYPNAAVGLDSSPLLDLGIDSLEWISVGLELEERLKLRLSEAQIGSAATVHDFLVAATHAEVVAATSPGATRDWSAPTGAVTNSAGALMFALDWFISRSLFRLHVEGRGNVPSGPCIVIANHTSYLDAPAIAAALGIRMLRRCYWAGDPQLLFSKPWQRSLMRALHGYPLDERQPLQALATSSRILERGDSIIWFPEGWRSPDGQLQAFLPGIGHLLLKTAVPVIPLWIQGAFEALPRDRAVPRLCPIRVRIGKPVVPADWRHLDPADKRTPQRIADLLKDVVLKLGADGQD